MSWFKQTISEKKAVLKLTTAAPMAKLAQRCAEVWDDPDQLDHVLDKGLSMLPHCQMLYAVNTNGILVSSNIETRHQVKANHLIESHHMDRKWRGTEIVGRPYLESTLPYQGFTISQVYSSRNTMKPSITVMHPVRKGMDVLGLIAADFDPLELPSDPKKFNPATPWTQFKGDPAIRGTLFMQERVQSAMDKRLDDVMDNITRLMQRHGIFHCKIHFSSSRASFWSMDDPYTYTIHMADELVDPDFCLAYPEHPLPERAQLDEDEIAMVLSLFKLLRNADETVYLRSSSLNLINGMVGLTFSCDGSHYIPYKEFLLMDTDFWFGTAKTETSGNDIDKALNE
ncbi:MAG: PDC sensor domain-containing protein [Gammaproteobacteria bacterium]|nr:PDC sensor domain-containing protein [Gammaproteobacteria bacterium]